MVYGNDFHYLVYNLFKKDINIVNHFDNVFLLFNIIEDWFDILIGDNIINFKLDLSNIYVVVDYYLHIVFFKSNKQNVSMDLKEDDKVFVYEVEKNFCSKDNLLVLDLDVFMLVCDRFIYVDLGYCEDVVEVYNQVKVDTIL